MALGLWRSAGIAPAVIWWIGLAAVLVLPVGLFLLSALSPRLFDQGSAWLGVGSFDSAIRSRVLPGIFDSILVGAITAAVSVAVALGLAWWMARTDLWGRGIWSILIWAVLLSPSYLVALGWEQVLVSHGAFWDLGLRVTWLSSLFFGPVGVTFVYITKGVPFAFLAVAPALAGIGREYEDAARIHGAGRIGAWRTLIPMLAPAIWAGLALVFAETISDFGIADTLAASSKFPLATFTLFNAIDEYPVHFPVAAAVGWFLVGAVGLALLLQSRAIRGRVYGVLSGSTRTPVRIKLPIRGQALGLGLAGGFFVLSLGVPVLGALTSSLLKPGAGHIAWNELTSSYYRQLIHTGSLIAPLEFSTRMAATVASVVAVLAVWMAHFLTRRQAGRGARLLDLLLLATIALPGIVLGAGYIFAYNLPFINAVGIHLYGTALLLGMAYLAGALPTTTRILVGPLAQVDQSPTQAARVHGAGPLRAWLTTVVPVVARSCLWAWLLTFTAVLFELPVSQMLYPPGQFPLSVAITSALSTYIYGPGTAMIVVSIAFALSVVAVATFGFRWLAPRGWRNIAAAHR
ncbi:MAG TPA: ABC transporter permease subunit [Candidatus Micrarchaeaceae archaeon]|nr:ABC transporter permease subunit [Candidatus Micrarchaeaceae archaeon]